MSRVWSVSVRPSPNRVSPARHSDAVLAQRKASLWLEQPLLMKLNGKRACLVHPLSVRYERLACDTIIKGDHQGSERGG